MGVTPFEQKGSEAVEVMEKMVVDFQIAGWAVAPQMEHAAAEALDLMRKTVGVESAGKSQQQAGHWPMEAEEEALMGH